MGIPKKKRAQVVETDEENEEEEEEEREKKKPRLNLGARNESGSMRQNQPKHNRKKAIRYGSQVQHTRDAGKQSVHVPQFMSRFAIKIPQSERHYDIACGVLQTTNVKCKFVTNLTISDAGLANTVKCTGCNKKCSTLFSIVSTKNRFFCKRVCMVEYLFLLSISQWNKEMRELRGKKKKINCLNAIKIFINLLLV